MIMAAWGVACGASRLLSGIGAEGAPRATPADRAAGAPAGTEGSGPGLRGASLAGAIAGSADASAPVLIVAVDPVSAAARAASIAGRAAAVAPQPSVRGTAKSDRSVRKRRGRARFPGAALRVGGDAGTVHAGASDVGVDRDRRSVRLVVRRIVRGKRSTTRDLTAARAW
jgi:hypothetical protein